MCDRIGIIRQGQIIESGSLADMRQFSRLIVTVTTSQPLTPIKALPAVHQFKATSDTAATFAVDSDALAGVMTALAPLGILSLQSTPPTLEDLFLRYYNQEGDGDAAK